MYITSTAPAAALPDALQSFPTSTGIAKVICPGTRSVSTLIMLLAVLLLVGSSLESKAQHWGRTLDPGTSFGNPPGAGAALPTLEGPWQVSQSSFDNTSDSQAKAEVVAALATILLNGPADRLSPPEVLSVYVSGRTASVCIETHYQKWVVKELVRLRLQVGRWQLADVSLLDRRFR